MKEIHKNKIDNMKESHKEIDDLKESHKKEYGWLEWQDLSYEGTLDFGLRRKHQAGGPCCLATWDHRRGLR